MGGIEMKLHKQDYKYKNEGKTLDDITEEVARNLIEDSKLTNAKPYRAVVRDNGRMIMAFRHDGWYEQGRLELEQTNRGEGQDIWVQIGDEKVISFSDEYENYNIFFAEFLTEDALEDEEAKYMEGMANDYFGVKEDDGRYSIYDVYSERELL